MVLDLKFTKIQNFWCKKWFSNLTFGRHHIMHMHIIFFQAFSFQKLHLKSFLSPSGIVAISLIFENLLVLWFHCLLLSYIVYSVFTKYFIFYFSHICLCVGKLCWKQKIKRKRVKKGGRQTQPSWLAHLTQSSGRPQPRACTWARPPNVHGSYFSPSFSH
jgi:hypothetical protein